MAIDYDPGATKINQENRIKLMLANAKRIAEEEQKQRLPPLPLPIKKGSAWSLTRRVLLGYTAFPHFVSCSFHKMPLNPQNLFDIISVSKGWCSRVD